MACSSISMHRAVAILGSVLTVMSLIDYVNSIYHQIEYEFFEEQPAGTVIGNIATDIIKSHQVSLHHHQPAINNNIHQYHFTQRTDNHYFRIDEETGDIISIRVLDREHLCPLYTSSVGCDHQILEVTISPRAKSSSSSPSSTIVQHLQLIKVIIRIVDVNDHGPVFPQQWEVVELVETTPVGTTFGIPEAEDPDSEPLSVLNYRMQTFDDVERDEDASETFRLESNRQVDGSHEVKVRLMRPLDLETRHFYSLVLYAIDGGTPPRSGSVQLHIYVRDANDNSPTFDSIVYEVRIDENVPLGTSVARIHATDVDSEQNGVVAYSLATADDSGRRRIVEAWIAGKVGGSVGMFGEVGQSPSADVFAINQTTGDVFVIGPVDFETRRVHELTVIATDLGQDPIPAFAKLTVYVNDVNDNPPRIVVNSLSHHRYQQQQKQQQQQQQQPHQPDFATTDLATAGDNGFAMIAENSPRGTFVCHVAVTDPDSELNSRFECSLLMDGTKSAQLFNLEPLLYEQPSATSPSSSAEYKLVTTAVLDREAQSRHRITIECHDSGRPSLSSTKNVDILVEDENDNTPVLPPSRTPVLPPSRTPVLPPSRTPVLPPSRTPVLPPSRTPVLPPSRTPVLPPSRTPVLPPSRTPVLPPSRTPVLPPSRTPVLPHAPPVLPPSRTPVLPLDVFFISVTENNQLGVVIATINATDHDDGPNGLLSYSLEPLDSLSSALPGTSDTGNSLSIDEDSGKITAEMRFDYELKQTSTYLLTVSDRGMTVQRSAVATVVLDIIDANDELPRFDRSFYSFHVSENRPGKTLVGRVRATDADRSPDHNQIFYFIDDQRPDGKISGAFQVNSLTGELFTRSQLDRETTSVWKFRVRATNDPVLGPRSAFSVADIHVHVDDQNDNFPMIIEPSTANRTYFVRGAYIPDGHVITRVHAIDPDDGANGRLSYSVLASTAKSSINAAGTNQTRLFAVDETTGDVRALRRIDGRADAGMYALSIAVRDTGLPKRLTTVAYLLICVNASNSSPAVEFVAGNDASNDDFSYSRIPERHDTSVATGSGAVASIEDNESTAAFLGSGLAAVVIGCIGGLILLLIAAIICAMCCGRSRRRPDGDNCSSGDLDKQIVTSNLATHVNANESPSLRTPFTSSSTCYNQEDSGDRKAPNGVGRTVMFCLRRQSISKHNQLPVTSSSSRTDRTQTGSGGQQQQQQMAHPSVGYGRHWYQTDAATLTDTSTSSIQMSSGSSTHCPSPGITVVGGGVNQQGRVYPRPDARGPCPRPMFTVLSSGLAGGTLQQQQHRSNGSVIESPLRGVSPPAVNL